MDFERTPISQIYLSHMCAFSSPRQSKWFSTFSPFFIQYTSKKFHREIRQENVRKSQRGREKERERERDRKKEKKKEKDKLKLKKEKEKEKSSR